MTLNSTPWTRAFNPRSITQEQQDKLAGLREGFEKLAAILDHNLPSESGESARYRALVKTKLEEAAMFATKAFTHG